VADTIISLYSPPSYFYCERPNLLNGFVVESCFHRFLIGFSLLNGLALPMIFSTSIWAALRSKQSVLPSRVGFMSGRLGRSLYVDDLRRPTIGLAIRRAPLQISCRTRCRSAGQPGIDGSFERSMGWRERLRDQALTKCGMAGGCREDPQKINAGTE
jgi:hypothetical protein